MREIKFRARDMATGEILAQLYIGQCFQWVNHERQHNIIIEQFTGLTDKNGVDIYEGDILSDHIGKGVVEYKERYAAFRLKYGKPNAGRGKWFLDYNLRGERESLEVIGNIHQNKGL